MDSKQKHSMLVAITKDLRSQLLNHKKEKYLGHLLIFLGHPKWVLNIEKMILLFTLSKMILILSKFNVMIKFFVVKSI